MKKLLVILFAVPLVGAGCLGGETSYEALGEQQAEILAMAIVDAKCEAWLSDATIVDSEDRLVIRDACYTAKAEATKEAKYCLSASEDTRTDCINLVAAVKNDSAVCLELYPKDSEFFLSDCLEMVALGNNNLTACSEISNKVMAEDCTEATNSCISGRSSDCAITAGPFIGCEFVIDDKARGRCETEYKSLAKYIDG